MHLTAIILPLSLKIKLITEQNFLNSLPQSKLAPQKILNILIVPYIEQQ